MKRPKEPRLIPALTAAQAMTELKKLGNPKLAQFQYGFMRAGPGEYAEGDRFLGLKVPQTRAVARSFRALSLPQVQLLIRSSYHEARLLALILLTHRCRKDGDKKTLYRFYLKNIRFVNHWDLVDVSAPHVVGAYLLKNDRSILRKWAKSKNLWLRRISVVATFALIRNGEFNDTLEICDALMADSHDLIHKATGWMLREVGKRDEKILIDFLRLNAHRMPRTMLRYAMERFSDEKRLKFLRAKARKVDS